MIWCKEHCDLGLGSRETFHGSRFIIHIAPFHHRCSHDVPMNRVKERSHPYQRDPLVSDLETLIPTVAGGDSRSGGAGDHREQPIGQGAPAGRQPAPLMSRRTTMSRHLHAIVCSALVLAGLIPAPTTLAQPAA